jgi:hypothetical protein
MSQLTADEQTILQAFQSAVDTYKHQGRALPEKIAAIGDNLERNIEWLDALSEADPTFEMVYKSTKSALQSQSHHRAKFLDTSAKPPTNGHTPPQSISASNGPIRDPLLPPTLPQRPEQPDASLQPVRVTPLPKTPAATSGNQPPEPEPEPSLSQRAILQALAKHPLRTQDLSYVISEPLHTTQSIVQKLWQQGYIDRLSAPLPYILLSSLRKPEYYQAPMPPDTFLSLTAKGYFHLYPLIQLNRRGIPAS